MRHRVLWLDVTLGDCVDTGAAKHLQYCEALSRIITYISRSATSFSAEVPMHSQIAKLLTEAGLVPSTDEGEEGSLVSYSGSLTPEVLLILTHEGSNHPNEAMAFDELMLFSEAGTLLLYTQEYGEIGHVTVTEEDLAVLRQDGLVCQALGLNPPQVDGD